MLMNSVRSKLSIGSGGFQIAMLVPAEAVIYGSLLTIGLKYGFYIAIPLIGITAYLLYKLHKKILTLRAKKISGAQKESKLFVKRINSLILNGSL